MLRALRRHALLSGTVGVFGDAVRYLAITLIVLVLLGRLARSRFSLEAQATLPRLREHETG